MCLAGLAAGAAAGAAEERGGHLDHYGATAYVAAWFSMRVERGWLVWTGKVWRLQSDQDALQVSSGKAKCATCSCLSFVHAGAGCATGGAAALA